MVLGNRLDAGTFRCWLRRSLGRPDLVAKPVERCSGTAPKVVMRRSIPIRWAIIAGLVLLNTFPGDRIRQPLMTGCSRERVGLHQVGDLLPTISRANLNNGLIMAIPDAAPDRR